MRKAAQDLAAYLVFVTAWLHVYRHARCMTPRSRIGVRRRLKVLVRRHALSAAYGCGGYQNVHLSDQQHTTRLYRF